MNNRLEKAAAILSVRHALRGLVAPGSFFSGAVLAGEMVPDNILFFKRTSTDAFRPEGVIDNYHHRFELVVVLEKTGPVRIGETSYLLESGEAVLIFPHQFHHYMDVEKGSMEWLFVTFEVGNAEGIESLRNSPRRLGPEEMTLLASIVREHTCATGEGGANTLSISYHLSRLLLGMTKCDLIAPERRDIHSGDRARDLVLEKINRYIGSHLSEAPTIATLAEALGYSTSHIRTVFRNQLGVSLGRYIRESRLSEAAKRLQSGEESISDIAQQCGFESHHAFSRAFKNAYGLPPKAYGKRLREVS